MALLKDTLIQGSARVTDTLYATNINLSSATASLPLFTDANKKIITKSVADTRTALGLGTAALYNASNGSYSSSVGLIPLIATNGVMEIGRYIDFHVDAASSKDYDVRLTASATGLSVSNTTASTAANAGALIVGGGIGTGAASYLTGSVHIIGTASNHPLIVRGISGCATTGNRGTGVNEAEQGLYLNVGGGPISLGYGNDAENNVVYVQYTQDASSPITGALRVSGGVGISKKLYIGSSTRAISTAKGSADLQICCDASDAPAVGIELRRGSLSSTTNGKASWQIINSANLIFRTDWTENAASQTTTYSNEVLKLSYNPQAITVTGSGSFSGSVTATGGFVGNASSATVVGNGSHSAAVTANEFSDILDVGQLTCVGNVSNTSMTHSNNANAELIIKAHPTSGTNYYEARLGFSSNGSLYYMPVNGTSWKTIAYTDSNITGTAANVSGTVAVSHGGTGVTSFTNDCAIVATGTTQTLASRGLKITGGTNENVVISSYTSGKTLTIESQDTLILNKPAGSSISFRSAGNAFALFNRNGSLQIGGETDSTQTTYRVYIKDSNLGLTGRIAFNTSISAEKASISYDGTLHAIKFVVT